MNNIYLTTLFAVAVLGALFGLGLALAAKKFKVEVDPRLEQLTGVLPGLNCGACGFANCQKYAEAVVREEAQVDGCPVGGKEVAAQVAEVMGVEVASSGVSKIAFVYCRGDREKALNLSKYTGIPSCAGAELVEGGFKACLYGCLGLGDCVRACPFGALVISREGLPLVDGQLCTACGKCVEACPRQIISLIDESSKVHVACNSRDKGKLVRQVCSAGCIGCKKCEKVCQPEAIAVKENLAVIDYEICNNCRMCVNECPTGAIIESDGKDISSLTVKEKAG